MRHRSGALLIFTGGLILRGAAYRRAPHALTKALGTRMPLDGTAAHHTAEVASTVTEPDLRVEEAAHHTHLQGLPQASGTVLLEQNEKQRGSGVRLQVEPNQPVRGRLQLGLLGKVCATSILVILVMSCFGFAVCVKTRLMQKTDSEKLMTKLRANSMIMKESPSYSYSPKLSSGANSDAEESKDPTGMHIEEHGSNGVRQLKIPPEHYRRKKLEGSAMSGPHADDLSSDSSDEEPPHDKALKLNGNTAHGEGQFSQIVGIECKA